MILILAAHQSELQPFFAGMTFQQQGELWHHASGEFALAAVGIGPVAAAVGATKLFAQTKPDQVILVGTAGAYPGYEVALGEARQIKWACQLDGACELGLSRYPLLGPGDKVQPSLLPGGPKSAKVGCLLGLTLDEALAKKIFVTHKLELENMEAYAIGKAADAYEIPWAGVLGVSNQVGHSGHEQWKMHRFEAQKAAFAAVFLQIQRFL